MMTMFVTLIIMGMLLQGVIAVLDSILDVAGIGGMLKGLPVIGANLSLIWAYLFVAITGASVLNDDGESVLGTGTEILKLGSFGTDLALAILLLAFGPIKDAAISALGKGVGR